MNYGPAFPFKNTVRSVLGAKTRREDLLTAIRLVITTPKGSVLYDPEFGSQIPGIVFEPITEALLGLIYYFVVHDLENQVPSVIVTSISVKTPEIQGRSNTILIYIGYRDRNDETNREEQATMLFTRV